MSGKPLPSWEFLKIGTGCRGAGTLWTLYKPECGQIGHKILAVLVIPVVDTQAKVATKPCGGVLVRKLAT